MTAQLPLSFEPLCRCGHRAHEGAPCRALGVVDLSGESWWPDAVCTCRHYIADDGTPDPVTVKRSARVAR